MNNRTDMKRLYQKSMENNMATKKMKVSELNEYLHDAQIVETDIEIESIENSQMQSNVESIESSQMQSNDDDSEDNKNSEGDSTEYADSMYEDVSDHICSFVAERKAFQLLSKKVNTGSIMFLCKECRKPMEFEIISEEDDSLNFYIDDKQEDEKTFISFTEDKYNTLIQEINKFITDRNEEVNLKKYTYEKSILIREYHQNKHYEDKDFDVGFSKNEIFYELINATCGHVLCLIDKSEQWTKNLANYTFETFFCLNRSNMSYSKPSNKFSNDQYESIYRKIKFEQDQVKQSIRMLHKRKLLFDDMLDSILSKESIVSLDASFFDVDKDNKDFDFFLHKMLIHHYFYMKKK